MNPSPNGPRLLRRLIRRAARLVVGDRILLPSRMSSTMWHLGTVRHRIRGGRIVVRFDNLDADITIDARSDLALRAIGEGAYEPDLLDVLPAIVGVGDLVNVGANVGIVAIALARAAAPGRRVLCIEPIPDCVDLLKANLAAAGMGDRTIVVAAFAAAAAAGSREMWTVPGKPEYSSGGPIVHAAVADDLKVRAEAPAVRLDDVVAESNLAPSAVVMDCEGGECHALRGAAATLHSHRPTIVMEFAPPLLRANGCESAACIEFLTDHGYGCLALDATAGPIHAEFSGTVIAVPTDRLAAVRQRVREAVSRP